MRTFSIEEKEDRKEAIRDMKMWASNGWDLKEETPEMFIMKKNTSTGMGHFWVFIFTFWCTFGIGNVVYYLVNNKKKNILK